MSLSLTVLDPLSDVTITDQLHKNFENSLFYSSLGQCLLSLNPSPVYSFKLEVLRRDVSLLQKCCTKEYDSVPESHIFKTSESIRRTVYDGTTSTAVIFKGNCGSGKSENMKSILQYMLCVDSQRNDVVTLNNENMFEPLGSSRNPMNLPSDSSRNTRIISTCSLVCDIMGSAAMEKNRHSTRLFKHCKLYFNPESNRILGMKMKVYGTDLLRFSSKDPLHGSAYMLSVFLAGIGRRAEEFKINSTMKDAFLNSADIVYPGVNLANEFTHLQHMLLSNNIVSEVEWDDVLRVIACCVNLQCLALVGSESTIISSSTKSNVSNVEGMLGLEAGSIGGLLLKRPDDRIGKPAGSLVDNKPFESRAIADALCNAIYSRAFEYLVYQCSVKSFSDQVGYERTVEGSNSNNALHLVDMPGWERSESNAGMITQLMINNSEERFHALFIDTIFINEIERYAVEGVQLGDIAFMNCTPYLELFYKPASGIVNALEDACQMARVDDKAYLDKLLLSHSKTDLKLVKAGGPKAKATAFIVKHTFADVTYDCEGFILGNKMSTLSAAALAMLATSKIGFISAEVEASSIGNASTSLPTPPPPGPPGTAPPPPGVAPPAPKSKSENKAAVIANYFMTKINNQLNTLITTLKSVNNTFYVLSIATANKADDGSSSPKGSISNMASKSFNRELVLNQVRHLQIESVVSLAKKGFSYVKTYYDFYCRFRPLQPYDCAALPYSIVDAYSSTGSTLNDTKLIELCKALLTKTLSTFQITVSEDMEPVYGKSSIFLKDSLSSQLESCRFSYLEVSQSAIKKLQSTYRMSVLFKQFRSMRKGVTKLQAYTRCNLLRGSYLAKRFAASKVKAYFRMHRKYKWFRSLKKSVNLIKSKLLGTMIQRIRYKRLLKASRMFQNIARGFNIRKIASRTFDAVRILQRCAKAFLNRRHYIQRVLSATIRIQYMYRGYSMRKRNVSLVNVLKMRREQRVATRVVRKLQSLWRGKLVNVRFQEIVNATLTLQRWLKSRVEHKKFNKLRRLVLWLQGMTRRLIAINRANTLRVSLMVNAEKGILSTLYSHELESIRTLPLTDRIVGSGLHSGKGIVNRFDRYLALFDVNFDLNFAYPEGWCSAIIQFTRRLKAEKKSVTKIVIGAQHTVIVDDLFNVYTMGLGDIGQLGHNNRQSFSQPKIIEKLSQYLSATENTVAVNNKQAVPYNMSCRVVVRDVCCGRDHSMLLTGSGRVYSWGDNKRGQLGHSKYDNSPFAKLVGDEKLRRVMMICCGAYHSACIVEPGLLYTWGAAECLGRVSTDSYRYKLHNNTNTQNTPFGRSTNYSLTNTDTVGPDYEENAPNQLYANRHKDSCEPDVLPFFQKKRVAYVCCGENHVTVKTATEFYAWGMNNQGQLGTGNTESSYTPLQLNMKTLTEMQMTGSKLFTGGRHMVLLVNGDMWLWGWNKYGQIGNGCRENVLKPTLVALANDTHPSSGSESVHSTSSLNSKASAKHVAASETKGGKPTSTAGTSANKSKHVVAPKTHHQTQQYVKSVSVGWRHVVAMTSTSQVYGWGMLNLSNDIGSYNDINSADLHTSECFLTPTLLNTILNIDCYTANGTGALLSLSGCSSSSLSVVGIDVELFAPLTVSSTAMSDRTRRPDATEIAKRNALHADEKLRREASSEKKSSSVENRLFSPSKTATATSATTPKFQKTFKATKLGSTDTFHINQDEFKQRLKQELGTGITMGTSVNNANQLITTPHSRSSSFINTAMGGASGTTNTISRSRANSFIITNDNRRRQGLKDGNNGTTTMHSYGEGVVDSPTKSLREREVPITADDLIDLFSPSHIKRIKTKRSESATEELNIDTSSAANGGKTKVKTSYGVSMPRTEKAFLATFAANHSGVKGTPRSPDKSSPSKSPRHNSITLSNSSSLLSPTLSYSSRLAARRASMDTNLLSPVTAMDVPGSMSKRLSFRTATGGGIDTTASRRSTVNDDVYKSALSPPNSALKGSRNSQLEDSALLVRRDGTAAGTSKFTASQVNSMHIDTKIVTTPERSNVAVNSGAKTPIMTDNLGLDSVIEKLRGDLERMNPSSNGNGQNANSGAKLVRKFSTTAARNNPITDSGGMMSSGNSVSSHTSGGKVLNQSDSVTESKE